MGSARAAKDAAMQQIHSETQRLIRESEISLPYHRPKQRTLQEFLNRKKVVNVLPEACSTAEKVKKFSSIISKAVEEREKEAEEFYKSSDSESDEDQDWKEENTEDKTSKSPTNNMTNDCQQKIIDLDEDIVKVLKSSQNENSVTKNTEKKESPKLKDHVSRKLFENESENDKENNHTITSNEIAVNSCTTVETPHKGVIETEETITNTSAVDDKPDTSEVSETKVANVDTEDDFVLHMSDNECDTEIPDANTVPDITSKLTVKETTEDDVIDSDIMNEDFGLPPPEFTEDTPVEDKSERALKKKILAIAANTKLRMSGTPGSIIDLTYDVKPTSAGVNKLLDRYISRHAAVKKPVEEKKPIITISDEETENTDVIPYTVPNINNTTEEEKPGAKLMRLKTELRKVMINKRNAEWKQKEDEAKLDEEDVENEKEFTDEELDDEEGDTESEPEEDDMEIKDKPRKKCIFGDDEAEESDAEESDAENIDEDEERIIEDDRVEDEDESDTEMSKPRKLKRIKVFDDDSNESVENEKPKVAVVKRMPRTDTDVDMFASQNDSSNYTSDADAEIPAFQKCRTSWPDANNQTPLPKKSCFLELVSPVTQLTALNSLDSTKKFTENSTLDIDDSYFREDTPANKKTSMGNLDKWVGVQKKKLFDDPPEKVDDQELIDMCSGKFDSLTGNKNEISNLVGPSTQEPVTESQLLNICSGAFATPSESEKKGNSFNKLMDPENLVTDSQLLDICSGSFNTQDKLEDCLKIDESSKNVNVQDLISKKIVPATSQNGFSQLINTDSQKSVSLSEILGVCSGSFDSTSVEDKKQETRNLHIDSEASQDISLMLDEDSKSSIKDKTEKNEEKTAWTKFGVESSSEDEGKVPKERMKKLTKKKVKQLVLSDDEDNANSDSEEEEENDSEEEEENEEEDVGETYIDYDSEENEVIVTRKDVRKSAKNFLENEAELTESEWDSADEDERNLDKLEREEGDDEDIDEEQMKDELGKIHAKQVLADDQREVRLLQDLLFEDGDLYTEGGGRERKFKWKNIDYGDDMDRPVKEDDYEDGIDEVDAEQELEIRKMRHERQKFMEDRSKTTNEIQENLESGEIFNIGLKINSIRATTQPIEKEETTVSVNQVKHEVKKRAVPNIISSLMSKSSIRMTTMSTSSSNDACRGSFLSRGESALIRIAQNIGVEKGVKPLRAGNFVFEHISPSVPVQEEEPENSETPASDNKTKRKRKPNAGMTPITSKKQKVEERKGGKKLF